MDVVTRTTGPIIDWWRRHRRSSARIDKVRRYPSVAALPRHISRHELAVAGEPAAWAFIECPCGHGHRLRIRIRPRGDATVWKLTTSDSGPSLHPSVDFDSDMRRCHFWLDHGRVRWVADDSRPRHALG